MRKALSPAALGFSKRDLKRLAKALREETDVHTFRRLQAVLLVAAGHDLVTTAHLTSFSQRSLYRLVKRYLTAHRADVLRDSVRSGRPTVAPKVTQARILQALQRAPLRLGYRTNVWTVELLAQHLSERYQCQISARTF